MDIHVSHAIYYKYWIESEELLFLAVKKVGAEAEALLTVKNVEPRGFN